MKAPFPSDRVPHRETHGWSDAELGAMQWSIAVLEGSGNDKKVHVGMPALVPVIKVVMPDANVTKAREFAARATPMMGGDAR